MANMILTSTIITREALRILHQKLNFVGKINRQYDDRFANSGAKIGSSLLIRLPNQYTVRTGAVMDVQDTSENSTTLSVSTQKGVDLNFTSVDLTMSLDDFSTRILKPAMSVLAANIEADAMSMRKDINSLASQSTATASLTFATVLAGQRRLDDNLAPTDDRVAHLMNQLNVDLVDVLKTLFQDSKQISGQFLEGQMGRAAGFDFMRSSLWTQFTTGSETATISINGSSQTGATLTVTNGSSKTLKAGDVVTFVGCNAVHPETKSDMGRAMQFVVTADLATSGTQLSISPSIVTSGATQNVTASPTTAQAITKAGAGASGVRDEGLLFHPDAFTFATADLVMPGGVDFASRQVMDGISMRIVRQYDINNDRFPCRLDVLYGYKTIRQALACRISANSTV